MRLRNGTPRGLRHLTIQDDVELGRGRDAHHVRYRVGMQRVSAVGHVGTLSAVYVAKIVFFVL